MKIESELLSGQVVVALAITLALVILGGLLVVAGILTHNIAVAMSAVGPIIGSLATALNAPTGISNALKANKPDADPPKGDAA